MLKLGFASLMVAVLAACVVYGFKGQVQTLESDLRPGRARDRSGAFRDYAA